MNLASKISRFTSQDQRISFIFFIIIYLLYILYSLKENVDIVEEVKRPNSATPLDVDTDDMADAEDEGTKYTRLLNKQVLRLELGSVTSAML